MAKFTVRAENFCLISHSTSSKSLIFNNPISLNHPRFHLLPSKRCLSCRVWCSIKEKENVKETDKFDGVLTGLRVDELDQASSVSDSEGELGHMSGSDQVGSEWNWPPWKNIPERYKFIGTTSLAFVICNMDKVNLSVAIIPMSHQFGWSSSVAGLVQSSFFWGYALSQLPGGWLAKVFGGRRVLQIGVLTWSLATALVPLVAGFMPGLVFSRILEKVFPRWLQLIVLPSMYEIQIKVVWNLGQKHKHPSKLYNSTAGISANTLLPLMLMVACIALWKCWFQQDRHKFQPITNKEQANGLSLHISEIEELCTEYPAKLVLLDHLAFCKPPINDEEEEKVNFRNAGQL